MPSGFAEGNEGGPGRPAGKRNVLTRPRLLVDFREVYRTDGKSGPVGIKRLFKDNLPGFIKQLNDMEKDFHEEKRKRLEIKRLEDVSAADDGESKALLLIDRLLAEWQGA